MGIPVLIIGESGSGKSSSLRNFSEDEIGIFNVAGKPLPFRKKLPKKNNATYATIFKSMNKPDRRAYVIDDSQYLLSFELFDRANENGYNKFSDIALHFRGLLDFIIRQIPDDIIVYFLHHSEESDSGKIKAKTVGKMLDNQLTVEGLFSIVLLATAEGGQYRFITQSDGMSTAKSPMDMFEREIPNDLRMVDATIREYWSMKPLRPDEDEAAKIYQNEKENAE